MLVRSKNQAAQALGLSRSYVSELSKKPGFPRRSDGQFDTEAIERFRKSVTDPARRKCSVRRAVKPSKTLPNIHHVNGFAEVEQIGDPAKHAVARMMVHAAGAAMWSAAWDSMEAGATIEVAFMASRLAGKTMLEMLAQEQAECGVEFLPNEPIMFDPPKEWVVDFAELAGEFGVAFDLDKCLAYEAGRKAA